MNAGTAQTYNPSFVNYVEGIYVGYKYYETAAAEGVINYDATVTVSVWIWTVLYYILLRK